MQTTTNYLLKKPDPSDAYDKQNDNGNMDLIDGQMKANADSATAAQNKADAAETPAGAQAKADAAELSAKTYADTQDNDLAGVGRTTETVKGNADAVATHLADTTAQDVGGTGTAITITLQSFTAYTDNYLLTFIAAASNAGAATTININGLGVKSVYKPNTVTAPNFVAGKAYTVWYDATGGNFFWKASAEGTAVAGDVLATKTFSNDDDSGIVGTMPNNGALGTITPTTTNQNIPAGYTSGGTVVGDVDLVASKIKNGVDIFGVNGSVLEATGAAADTEVLSGKTFSRAGAVGRTGTMPNRGNVGTPTITTQNGEYSILAGYHNGLGKVKATFANLLSENVRDAVDIGGVVGNLVEGKQWASGSLTTNANGTFSVTGLAFTPTTVIAYVSGSNEFRHVYDTNQHFSITNPLHTMVRLVISTLSGDYNTGSSVLNAQPNGFTGSLTIPVEMPLNYLALK